MTTTYFTWLVLFGGLFTSATGALYLTMLFALFGAAAAITLPALGGATITPVVMFVPLLFAVMLKESGLHAVWHHIAYPRAGFWLLLTALWGVFSAYIMPRLFMDEVLIRTVDRNSSELGAVLVPLHPVSTNLTQSAYALGAVVVFVAVSVLLTERSRVIHFRNAVLWLAALNCLGAAINLAEIYLSAPALLQYIRTANYAIFNGGELGGLRRISGTFSESSVFSMFTLTLFAFTFSLWCRGVKSLQTGMLSVLSLLLLLFSTSATAYVGLGIYLSMLWAGWLRRRSVPRPGTLIIVLWIFAVLMLCLLLLEPDLGRRIGEFFDTTVFNKLQSESGTERSAWNRQAWSSFVSTYGLGVGLGSGYASSYPLVLLSNLGIPGTLFFLAFLYQVLFASPAGEVDSEAAITLAARHAVVATLIAATLSAAVFYLGMAFFAYAAVAQGRATWRWQDCSSSVTGSAKRMPLLYWRQVLASGRPAMRPSSWLARRGSGEQESY